MNPTFESKVERILRERVRSDNQTADYLQEFSQAPLGESMWTTKWFLWPHSKEYYSTLNPVFLHDVNAGDLFSQLSRRPYLFRDGLLHVACFFESNPEPVELDPDSLILVNRRFAPFVPDAWRENVAYYRVATAGAREPSLAGASDAYVIVSKLDDRQCSPGFCRERLRRLREALGAGAPETRIHILVVSGWSLGGVEGSDRQTEHFFEELNAIHAEFGAGVRYVDWRSLQQRDLRGSVFLDLNELDFYYSDSFVVQHFLSRGAIPFPGGPAAPDWDSWTDASVYHGYGLYFRDGSASPDRFAELRGEMRRFLSSRLYLEERTAFERGQPSAYEKGVKFCPLSFETMVYALARKYLAPSPSRETQR